MGKTVAARLLIAVLVFWGPLHVMAAGLGKLTVLSALGQPLSAEIEIVSLQAGEEDSLAARFAPSEAYRQAGIEFNSVLLGVKFAVDRRDGKPIIKLASNTPVSEPFLSVLVELSWNTGRLVREYTFLLDPPEYKGVQPSVQAAAPVARPIPVPAPAPAPAAAVEARAIAAAPTQSTKGSYEVKKGDTLAKIATKTKPEGVSLQQMLIALYRTNPDAFVGNNINRLRAGRILNLPDQAAGAAVDQADARRLIAAQAEDFRAYQRKLAGEVAAAPAQSSVGRQTASGKIAPKAEEPAAEKKDQLKLAKADPEGKTTASKAARADDAASRNKALQESQSRVADLEKNVEDLKKLLELKNQTLAELERKAGAKADPAKPAPPAPVKPVVDAAKPAPEVPKPAPPAPPAPAKPAVDAAKPAVDAAKPAPDAPKPVADPAPAAVKPAVAPPKPKPAPPPPPPPPPSLIDEFVDNPIALGGLGGVVLLLVGYGAWAWRRKKAEQSRFQDSVMGAPPAAGLGAASVFSDASAQTAGAAAQAPQISVGDASVGAADPDEVDPIAEADVYMAYGRDTQAEEILKDALGKDPNRLALHTKLAEVYAGRGDVQNLEQCMVTVQNLTGGQGSDWERAVAIAHAADPSNTMYGGDVDATVMVRPSAAAAESAPSVDFDLDADAPAVASADISLDAQVDAKSAPASVDFDLDAGDAAPAEGKTDFAPGGTIIVDTKEIESPSGGLDFDLGMDAPQKPTELASAPAPAAPEESASGGLDFNLDLESDADKTVMMPSRAKPEQDFDSTVMMPSSPKPEMDLSAISFDLGTLDAPATGGEADPRWQEVATKLDLAKAYEEMGDKDGARDLLNEVVKEGDEAQQNQARQMLAKIG